MKKLLALAVLATSTVAYSASDIYDLMYLPKAGSFYGISEVEYLKREVSGKSGAADTDLSGFQFNQVLGYSFTDRFSLQAELTYGNFEIDPDDAAKTDQTGVSDPRFLARYRLMDEAYRWDILGGLLISRGNSEIESSGDTDNLNGGHAYALGTQFGQKTEAFQWTVGGLFTHNLERTLEQGSAEADLDPSNALEIRADFLNKLAEKSFIRYFASAEFTEIVESDDLATGKTYAAPDTTYSLGGEYQHLFSADLLGRVGLTYDMSNHDASIVDSDTAWTFLAAANYQF